MADINNLGRMISKFVNYQALNAQRQMPQNQPAQSSFTPSPTPQAANAPKPTVPSSTTPQMGNMGGSDQSVFVKDMMNLPKNMNELVYMLQRNITLAQLNQRFANQVNMQRNAMSQTQAQILAQL